ALAFALLTSAFVYEIRADVLDDWNDAVLNAIRRENTAPCLAARNLAIVHLAIYDAINSIERTHRPYLSFVPYPRFVSPDAAAAGAAFRAASALFPAQSAMFRSLWLIQSETDRTNGAIVGFAAADALLDARASDGSQTQVTYFPTNQPGAWRRTPPFYRPPESPHWASLRPFAIQRCDQFRPAHPPNLVSTQYAADFNRVKLLGAKSSTARTAHETETALFWSDFTSTVTPPGHWNQI